MYIYIYIYIYITIICTRSLHAVGSTAGRVLPGSNVNINFRLAQLMLPDYMQCCRITLTCITDESTIKLVSPDIAATA